MDVFRGSCRTLCCAALLALAAYLRTGRLLAQQRTPEEASFEAARAITDPEARLAALAAFLEQFPSGSRRGAGEELQLQTYLQAFPGQTAAIHTVAFSIVAAATPGFDRWVEESRVAGLLAGAGTNGSDLPGARSWADDALRSLTEESYRREMIAAQVRYKLPRVPPRQMHAHYVEYRASFLSSDAAVDLCDGRLEHASALLSEAFRLQPLSAQVNALRGKLALAQHDEASALQSLERAEALGGLPQSLRDQEVQLFANLKHGDQAALELRVDEVYRGLFAPLFTLPKRSLPAGGHTALLELFTGSGCLPCAGPDLALESLLTSYSRNDLVVLAYDDHIPRPDPLTTPDSVTRAAAYSVASTPAAFLDGQPADILGASRQDVENIVVGLAEQIEEQAQLPSGLRLQLEVATQTNGDIVSTPTLGLAPASAATAAGTTGDVSLRKLARAVLYVALVQDDLRYSGENGIRFHRMVVRSMAQFPAASLLGTSSRREPVVFNPDQLERANQAYLTEFEQHNDRFGAIHFASKTFSSISGRLAVVAWVQDPATKRVLQAAYASVPAK